MSSAPVGLKSVAYEVSHSKSGLAGIIILASILLVSMVAVFSPENIIEKWNDPQAWLDKPRLAAPEWVTIFTGQNSLKTVIIKQEDFRKDVQKVAGLNTTKIELRARITYNYDTIPTEVNLNLEIISETRSLLTVRWVRPDGSSVLLLREAVEAGQKSVFTYRDRTVFENVQAYLQKLAAPSTLSVGEVLFSSEDSLLKGTAKLLKSSDVKPSRPYELVVEGVSESKFFDVNAQLNLLGSVYGLCGTDNMRRDIFVGIVWGAPIALAFGLVAALVVTLVQAVFGAISGFYGSRVDEIIQRVTDIYLVLPFLSLLITIQFIYKTTIWTLLIAVIALSLFGGVTKSVRSMALQIREEPYIEAAKSYGASRPRILFLYILPRLLPYTFANITVSVPAYVFLEASLSILGLGDPALPTWGKIISEAFSGGAAYYGYWWWILIPSIFIVLVSTAFALLWYSLDKVLNPRLREE
ncbi:MAG: ABC transporter permease [Nitrososphaerales archaeon]